jgi:hypothetical protein
MQRNIADIFAVIPLFLFSKTERFRGRTCLLAALSLQITAKTAAAPRSAAARQGY